MTETNMNRAGVGMLEGPVVGPSSIIIMGFKGPTEDNPI